MQLRKTQCLFDFIGLGDGYLTLISVVLVAVLIAESLCSIILIVRRRSQSFCVGENF